MQSRKKQEQRISSGSKRGFLVITDGPMKKVASIISLGLTILTADGQSQKGPDRYFGEPVLTDTLSTLFIPTRYNNDFFSSNKIAFWGDYYANIVVYNYKTDSYKKLFDKDTF